MAFTLKTLGFSLSVVICLLLENAQFGESTYIPRQCVCPKTVPFVPERLISDFSITEKGPHCQSDEIVVTLQNGQVCLSAEKRQGQHLITCWNRINKDENKKMSCLRKRKPHNMTSNPGGEE